MAAYVETRMLILAPALFFDQLASRLNEFVPLKRRARVDLVGLHVVVPKNALIIRVISVGKLVRDQGTEASRG